MILGLANIITGFMGGNVKDAKSYGFLPTASASTNKTALNNALAGGGTINITTPGVYNIDDTIYIPSNTTLRWCAGFNFRKTANFGPVLMNKGALTGVRNTNIKIYGNSAAFADLNGYETDSVVFGMRGIISFLRVDNFVVDGFNYVGTGTYQFFFQLCDVTNGLINNLSIESAKDGIDILGPASNITITNLITKTGDDGIAIGSFGYPTATPLIGDVNGITITNWTDLYKNPGSGFGLRIQASGWLNWASGNTYQVGDAVTNSGYIYRRMNSGDVIIGTTPPVHTSGVVTGADGIQWRCLQAGTQTGVTVKNITLTNITTTAVRPLLYCNADVEPLYTRTIYPGAFGNNLIDNIVLDNITWTPGASWNSQTLISAPDQNIGTLTIKNSVLVQNGSVGNIIITGAALATVPGAINTLIFDNCHIDLSNSSSVYGFIAGGGNSNYPFTFTNIKFLNSYIKGNRSVDGNHLLNAAFSNQYNNILIQGTTLDYLERMVSYSSNVNTTVTMSNSIVTNSKYFLATAGQYDVISLTATNSVFNQPTGWLFYNNYNNTTFTVNSTGSSGTVDHEHVKGGAGTITITGDLP